MGYKLLFFLGIVLAHGALAASLMHVGPPRGREPVTASCVNTPAEEPYFAPPREMLAKNFLEAEVVREVTRP